MRSTSLARQLALCLSVFAVVVAGGCRQSEAVSGVGPGTPLPIDCPEPGSLGNAGEILPELLPSDDTLYDWQRRMVGFGPRFTGSPALKQWHDLVAAKFESLGLEVQREPMPIDWWDHQRWSLTLIEDGVETQVAVASYFPYSGHTPAGGVTAPLVDAGKGLPPEILLRNLEGRIAYFEADQVPTTLALFYPGASYVHDPDRTISPLTDYTRKSLSFLLVPQLLAAPVGSLSYARQQGAAGAIISLQGSAENVAGQYTPFMGHPGSNYGVPTLYVDRATGDGIKAAIARGAEARLELVVQEHVADTTDDIVATLPGMTDEVMIFNSHSDGPSATEENGGIGVMAMAQYFASLPKECRKRTMVFVLTPGHFHGGIGGDTDRFVEHHPEIVSRAVASLTMEHLGQMEWLDDAQGYRASGEVEPAIFFGSIPPAVQTLIANAVIAEDLRRTIVSRPIAGLIYFGVGSPLNGAGVPNAAYITGPHSMLSFADNQHLDQIDAARMGREVRTFARIAAAMEATDSFMLCAGMLPGGNSGC